LAGAFIVKINDVVSQKLVYNKQSILFMIDTFDKNSEKENKETIKDKLKKVQFILSQNGVQCSDFVFVGSIILEELEIREARDIDVALSPDIYNNLRTFYNLEFLTSGTINFSCQIQSSKDRYGIIGVNDKDLLNNPLLYYEKYGFRFARPELELGKKIFRNREKDRDDIIMLHRYSVQASDWRWDLIPVAPVKSTSSSAIFKPMSLSKKAFHAVKKPKLASEKIFKKILDIVNKTPRALKTKDLTVSTVDVGTLLQWQFDQGQFGRYDTLVRIDTLDKFINTNEQDSLNSNDSLGSLNDKRFIYYKKMQEVRVQRNTLLRFQELAYSIKLKGFHVDRYPLTVDTQGRLIDGSHRLACALALNVDRLPVRFLKHKKGPTNYGREWFETREFPKEYLTRLDSRLYDILLSTGTAFVLIVWPPALPFTNEIEQLIGSRFPIIAQAKEKYIYDFESFVQGVYLSDDIELWKVQKKIFHMRDYPPVVSVFSFLIEKPLYRAKARTESYLSDTVAKLKAELIEKYRDKINGYVYDISVHIGDNPSMNRDIKKIIAKHNVIMKNYKRSVSATKK